MAFSFSLDKLIFSAGEEVSLAPSSMLVLFGPNNGGKSTALREIQQALAQPGSKRVVVRNVESSATGTASEFEQWVRAHFPVRHPVGNPPHFATRGAWVSEEHIQPAFQNGTFKQSMHQFLLDLLGTEDRLTLTKWGETINLVSQPPQRYIHVMQTNDAIDAAVRAQVRDAFGQDLIINRGAGREVGFHVGIEPPLGGKVDRVSESYLDALNSLPRLDDQGDGLRSYVGSVLAAFCGPHPILLLDEPEAFLHPPQARRLASALAKTAAESRQIIVATHSADVVEGAVASGVPVTVCRVTRDGEANRARTLESAELKEMWSKPLLRSAAAIQGIFHEGVVICESDADCRVYEAAVRRSESLGLTSRAVDLYFAHGGGKGQLASLTHAYRVLGVECRVIADLDLLRNLAELRQTVEALGMDWTAVEREAEAVARSLGAIPPLLNSQDFLAALEGLLDQAKRQNTDIRRDVERLVSEAAEWSDVKRYGVQKLRSEPRRLAEGFLAQLASRGLFLVPVGELEGWYQTGSTQKAVWFPQAMEEIDRSPDSMPELQSFVVNLLQSFGYT